MARVYVGGITPEVQKEDLQNIFAKHGPLRAVDIKPARDNRAGFAFLEYEDARDADDAVRARDGYEINGARLRVEHSKGGFVSTSSRGPPKRSPYRVRVTGLPQSASWQDLKDHMRSVGEVGFAEVYRERGEVYGVAEYSSREDLDAALSKLHGSTFSNRFNDSAVVTVKEDDGAPPPAGPPRGGGYDDRAPPRGGHHDDRRGGHDDRYGPPPPRGGYDDRAPRGYDDRYGPPPSRGGYEERRGGGDRSYDDRYAPPPRYEERGRGGYERGHDDRRRERSRSRGRDDYAPAPRY